MNLTQRPFLWASTSPWLRDRAMKTSFIRRSVARFMPGERMEDAIEAARALQPGRINTILTHLGENLTGLEQAAEVREHYFGVLDAVRAAKLDAQISVKPTQLGQDEDPEVCARHCTALLDKSEATGNFLWLDMESSGYVDGTLALYRRLRERSPRIGVAIQSYLYRSAEDIEELIRIGAAIRLVKGAYLEPASVAHPKKRDVDESYFALASRLLEDSAARPGALVHIATHDIGLQDKLRALIAERKVPRERYEFAMLYGIQTARQHELAAAGEATRCLISYGASWFPWYMRRLAERPANVWFVARTMFKR